MYYTVPWDLLVPAMPSMNNSQVRQISKVSSMRHLWCDQWIERAIYGCEARVRFCYCPCLDTTGGRPFGVYLHGNEGTEGAQRGIDSITTGLGWTKAADTVVVSGKPSKDDLEACWNLGATVAAQLMG